MYFSCGQFISISMLFTRQGYYLFPETFAYLMIEVKNVHLHLAIDFSIYMYVAFVQTFNIWRHHTAK